jgi:hypothetical protein
VIRYLAWAAVGVLFMTGNIAPVGKVLWIPAAVLAAALLAAGARTPRYFFACVAGIGATLVGLAIVNDTYLFMAFYGTVLIGGGITGFLAFGPRTSHADPPETFD